MSSNRTPWIIAGALGCLVLCLLAVIALGAVGALSGMFNIAPTAMVRPVTPVVILPTIPAAIVTQPPRVQTLIPTSASPTPAQVQPTIPQPTVAQLTPLPPVTAAQLSPVPPTAIATKPAMATGKIAFSKNEGDRPEDKYIWVMNVDGTGAKKILDRASHAAFSPDGTKIVFYHWTDGLWVASANGTEPKKIVGDTFVGGNYGSPDWSHDGRLIAFSAQPGGAGNIVVDVVAPDGTGRRTVVVGEAPSWSPDDAFLTFHTCRGSSCGIYKASAAGGDAVPISTDDGGLPSWSPDGKRIVYQKDVESQKQLFVVNADGTGRKQLTSGSALHVDPVWSLDGNSLFYRSPEGGAWGLWVMGADGTNPRKLLDNAPPVNWPYERLAISK